MRRKQGAFKIFSLRYKQEDLRISFGVEIVPSNGDFPTQYTWSFSSVPKKEDSRELILLPYWTGIMEYIVNNLVLT